MKKFIPQRKFNIVFISILLCSCIYIVLIESTLFDKITILLYILFAALIICKFMVKTSADENAVIVDPNNIDVDIPLSKFMRPKSFVTNDIMTLANKFCIVKFDFKNLKLSTYNKFSDSHIAIDLAQENKTKDDLKLYFDELVKDFNYQTTYKNIVYFFTYTVKIYFKESKTYTTKNILDLNNASSAELLGIPGINAAKANKVLKYLINNDQFNNLNEFISFIGMNEKNAQQLKKYVSKDCKCDIQKLQFYTNHDNQYKYW